ncbi:hypothetical protein RJT34_30669 [Clitoria ternatea]|uniref:Uncharacterized protein n=1 Tax=Clitoria ternatea TaxID=43366 RepID=A0AAN9EXF5_CLITE
MEETSKLGTLSTLFQERLNMIMEIVEKSQKNETNKQILMSTLKDMTPIIQEIKQYNEYLNPPRKEIKTLIMQYDAGKGKELVCKCSSKNLWCDWNKCFSWLPIYNSKIWHNKDDSFIVDDNQALAENDIKETLYKLREILELLSKENFEQKLNGVGAPIKHPFSLPKNPEFIVGLDVPLSMLKMEVLKEGESVLILTGLGGSGKTTLATRLCWEEQVRDKFKQNILFATFSKTPKLKIIVETLFEQRGYQVPQFQNDEDAINQLGVLLRKFEGSPILLVLDDVWPGSDALVEKFQFRISEYKILVTSRAAFSRFGIPYILKPLSQEDAMTLFHHYALLDKSSVNIPDEDLVQKVVKNCKGLPLAIKVIGRSLSHQPYESWKKMEEELSQGHFILSSNTEVLTYLQKILDVLEDNLVIKECFMDLGLFPEDQRIPVTYLIDMWAELYGLDNDGIEAMSIINKLDSMNLANVLIARKNTSDIDNYYYNNHFIILHDLLRDLAIYQSIQEPIEQRKRLIVEPSENKGEWWLGNPNQGMITRTLAKLLRWCTKENPQLVLARTLSISIDETSASNWIHMQPSQAEVLILNLRTNMYSFPDLSQKMIKLKVLIVKKYGFYPSQLTNLELLGSIFNLKRIILERISILSFSTLRNLKKLSLYMCHMSHALKNGILISHAFPNLEDLSIDYCKDMMELPIGLCDINPLKKLSVTNCHKLFALPEELEKLENLELLRLSSCTDLKMIPNSIGRLSKLKQLDISNCISLLNLPEEFGNLCNMRNVYMTSCARCELPFSVANLKNLKTVICDEETAASWEAFEPMLPNLKIEVPHVEVNLNWLHSDSA